MQHCSINTNTQHSMVQNTTFKMAAASKSKCRNSTRKLFLQQSAATRTRKPSYARVTRDSSACMKTPMVEN